LDTYTSALGWVVNLVVLCLRALLDPVLQQVDAKFGETCTNYYRTWSWSLCSCLHNWNPHLIVDLVQVFSLTVQVSFIAASSTVDCVGSGL